AVHHVPADSGPLHDDADRLSLTHVDDVLRTALVWGGRPTVAIEDLEVGEVNVHRMEPATRRVLELPDLDVVALRLRQRELEVAPDHVLPRGAVDRPTPAVALEVEPAGGDGLAGLQRHDLV